MGNVSDIKKRRGPPKGTVHAGTFKKGFDPRRHIEGPRVVKKEFQAAIKEHTDKAIEVLVSCMDDDGAAWKERQAAAELVLAHGHGQPVSRHLMSQLPSEGHTGRSMGLDELRARAQNLLEQTVIEGEVTDV